MHTYAENQEKILKKFKFLLRKAFFDAITAFLEQCDSSSVSSGLIEMLISDKEASHDAYLYEIIPPDETISRYQLSNL
jgi:hypothetical protein